MARLHFEKCDRASIVALLAWFIIIIWYKLSKSWRSAVVWLIIYFDLAFSEAQWQRFEPLSRQGRRRNISVASRPNALLLHAISQAQENGGLALLASWELPSNGAIEAALLHRRWNIIVLSEQWPLRCINALLIYRMLFLYHSHSRSNISKYGHIWNACLMARNNADKIIISPETLD